MDDLLYPALSEQGQKEAQIIIDRFREKMKKVCDETLSEFYVDVSAYIESDHWTNYRNQIMNGLKGYEGDLRYDYKGARAVILKEHREEIIKDLNQDLLAEIDDLKAQLKHAYDRRY
jgi:arginyl-tRNA synthetase